jgi:hypothetical protein
MKKKISAIVIAICATISISVAQNKPAEFSVIPVKNNLGQTGIKIGFNYNQSLDSIFEVEHFKTWDKGLMTITPSVRFETGTNGVFSALSGKMTGFMMFFDTTNIGTIVTPRTDKVFHTIPISVGFETSNDFQIVNGIIEIGYMPWYQMPTAKMPALLKHTTVAVFLEAGYNFGSKGVSPELPNKSILRAKGHFGIHTQNLFVNPKNGRGFALIGSTNGWYDVLNAKAYYRLEAKLRWFLSTDYFADFIYEKGSGAPTFVQGKQMGIGFTKAF